MWSYFNIITYLTTVLWLLGGGLIYSKSKALRSVGIVAHLAATLLIGGFIVVLWQHLERPPLRTLAETRIWYAFFMGLIGYAIYLLYRQKWMLSYSAVMGIIFVGLTYTHPDTMNKALMPALQSVWFIPHVIVYIFAYAMLGMASLTAFYGIYRYKRGQEILSVFALTDQLSQKLAMYSLPLGCSSVPFGRRKHGDTIGHGILRKRGLLSLGWAIWSIYITSIITKKRSPYRVLSL